MYIGTEFTSVKKQTNINSGVTVHGKASWIGLTANINGSNLNNNNSAGVHEKPTKLMISPVNTIGSSEGYITQISNALVMLVYAKTHPMV